MAFVHLLALFALAVIVWMSLVALYVTLLVAHGQRDKRSEVAT